MGAVAVKMGFIKVVKNKAYFKRFQVKYKRRREGKTDYYARKRLVTQDKNKFGTPKYRFVVRFTNKDIICQVVSSKIKGDVCHAAAYAHELPRYGLSVGLTNYSAAYCVGLLCARRLLTKYGLADKFEGTEEVTAEFEDCYVLNNEDEEEGVSAFHAESNRERILGGHVAEYMTSLQEEEPEEYEEKFKKHIEAVKTEKKKPSAEEIAKKKNEGGIRFTDADGKEHFINQRRRTLAQRKNRVAQKKAFVLSTLADDSAEEEDEE